MKQPKISVILTCWQRPHLLEEQVERIYAQSVQPHEVILWYNAPPKRFGFIERKQLVEFKNDGQVKKILCSHNLGIIPRFTLASCLEGEYICIFDDDTMPGKLWFENCLRQTAIKNHSNNNGNILKAICFYCWPCMIIFYRSPYLC